MKKPRILFVAPDSYPPINPEANVNAKVLKLLSDYGCIIDVVCRTSRKRLYSQKKDNLFFYEKVKSLNVVTTNTKKDITTIFKHINTYFKLGFVYRGADWAYDAVRKCVELISIYNYDYIYTYGEPSELVGLYITKKFGIKWVATWNDPYIWKKYPSPYGDGADSPVGLIRRNLITQIGKYTYINAFPSDRLRDYMLQYMTGMKLEKTVILPHLVCDELTNKTENSIGDVLRIIHSGALGRERDPKTFFEGIQSFFNKYPDAKCEISLLGVCERVNDNYIINLVNSYGLQKRIKILYPVSYIQSLDIVKQYDLCIVLEADLKEGIFLPSKIADYLQNQKPIFAISPQKGVLHDEYKNGIVDYFADVRSANDISNELIRIYCDFNKRHIGNVNKDDSKYRNQAILSTHIKSIFNL